MYTREIPRLPDDQPLDLFNQDQDIPGGVSQLHRLHDLRQALNHFNSMDESAVRVEPDIRYGSPRQFDPSNTADARRSAQQAEHDTAFAYFARAYLGAAALRAASAYEPMSPQYKEAWTSFQSFKKQYVSPRRAEARIDFWKQLTNQIASAEGKDEPYELTRPVPGVRPGDANYPETLGEGKEVENTLTTLEKMHILSQEDTRAGFLPTTHREKNSAVEMLDYVGREISSPASGKTLHTPDRVDQRLGEIFGRQIKARKANYAQARESAGKAGEQWSGPVDEQIEREAVAVAVDTVRSKVQEEDDSFLDAHYSKAMLIQMKQLVENHGSPQTKLVDLLKFPEAKGIDAVPFIRYVVLKFFVESGELPAFDPMVTREIRPAPADKPHKNKIVTDTFQYVPDSDVVIGELEAMKHAITKRTILELIDPAIIDSDNRQRFHGRILRGVGPTHRAYAQTPSKSIRVNDAG